MSASAYSLTILQSISPNKAVFVADSYLQRDFEMEFLVTYTTFLILVTVGHHVLVQITGAVTKLIHEHSTNGISF